MSLPLPVYRDRPAFIPHAGGRIYISVHDAEYLRQRSEWRRKLAAAHPDSPTGNSFTFRRLKSQRDKWEATEVEWYAQHGLTPPELSTGRAPSIAPELLALADAGGTSTRARVSAHLALHPDATVNAIADALILSRNAVAVAMHRLRKASPRTPSRAGMLLRVLADGQPHSHAACAAAINRRHSNELTRALNTLNTLGFDVMSTKRPGEKVSYRLLGVSAR